MKNTKKHLDKIAPSVALAGTSLVATSSQAAIDTTAVVAELATGATTVETVAVALIALGVSFLVGWALYRKIKGA